MLGQLAQPLEISREVVQGLAQLNALQEIGDAAVLDQFVSSCFLVACSGPYSDPAGVPTAASVLPASVPAETAAVVFTSTLALILESSKLSSSADEVQSVLQEAEWAAPVAAAFLDRFAKYRDRVRGALGQRGIQFSAIVDLDWRLGYRLGAPPAAGGEPAQKEAAFLLELTVEDAGQPVKRRKVKFWCSHAELQALLEKVRDAVHTTEQFAEGRAA